MKKRAFKTYLVFILIIFFISPVLSASCDDTFLGTKKKGTTINLPQTCSNCTFNNITTLIMPNGTEIRFNALMIKDGTVYNFSLNSTFTNDIGRFIVNGVNDLNGDTRIWLYDFRITKNGFCLDEAESRVYFLLFISFLILLCLALLVAIFTPFSNKELRTEREIAIIKVTMSKYLKLFAMWFTYGFYMALLTLLTGLTQNYINFPEMRSLMTNVYTYSYGLFFGLTTLMIFVLVILVWKDILFNKEIIKSGKAFVRELQ